MITAGNYVNLNGELQRQRRSLLGELQTVRIIPRLPLQAGKVYTMALLSDNGEAVRWSFTTSANPLNLHPMQVLLPHAD